MLTILQGFIIYKWEFMQKNTVCTNIWDHYFWVLYLFYLRRFSILTKIWLSKYFKIISFKCQTKIIFHNGHLNFPVLAQQIWSECWFSTLFTKSQSNLRVLYRMIQVVCEGKSDRTKSRCCSESIAVGTSIFLYVLNFSNETYFILNGFITIRIVAYVE